MSTMIYAPGIRVYIDATKIGTLLDVSDDLINGTLTRRQDAPSDFSFSLNNARRKYDNVFTPNDRIVVMAKRITWMQVYTGYLNSVPVVSAWPRVVNVTSECSLKRLKYFYWNPNLVASRQLVMENLNLIADGSEPDGGIKNVVLALLEDVVDWSGTGATASATGLPQQNSLKGSKVHIGGIPNRWFNWVTKIRDVVLANLEEEQALVTQLRAKLGASGTVAGSAANLIVGSIGAGTYGDTTLTDAQAAVATQILNAAVAKGVTDTTDLALTIGCAMQESSLVNSDVAVDKDSVGVFQQRPSQGWGTVAQCSNIDYATGKFLDALLQVHDRGSMSFAQAIQTVQRSGKPDAYAARESMARAVVDAFVKQQANAGGTLAGDNSFGATTATTGGPRAGTADSSALAQAAATLIARLPNIAYNEGGDSPPTEPNPTVLDCSSFVQWCYFQVMGGLNGMPRTSQAQYDWARKTGTQVSPENGMTIPGCLMFGVPTATGPGHIEISVGDGKHTIGSHSPGTVASMVESAGYWTAAVVPPGMTVSHAKISTGGGSASGFPVITGTPTAGQPSDFLFGSTAWQPLPSTAGPDEAQREAQSLTGIRRLLNDEPILPYINNLMGSCMRSYSSAPNGDFLGWFPDYYGLWGTAAKMVVEPIEITDFTMDWDDTGLVTHQFVGAMVGGVNVLDVTTGSNSQSPGNQNNLQVITQTAGVATIEIPAVMAALFGQEFTADKVLEIYKRFGPRPNYTTVNGINTGTGEFFFALYLFMKQWAFQYNANVGLTWMPELWPGMLMALPSFNFQCYINEVTHQFSFGPGGSFTTTVNIAAPARISGTDPQLDGLPLAGDGTGNGGQELNANNQAFNPPNASQQAKLRSLR